MRLFLSEFVTSGACSAVDLPGSLMTEGRAMRDALVADFANLPDTQIVLTSDRRVPPPPLHDRNLVFVDSPCEESVAFRRLAQSADATCLIAPELDGILRDRCRIAAELSPRLLNATPSAIELCSDKLALFEHLVRHGIPTIPTWSPHPDGADEVETVPQDQQQWASGITFPVIVKPRFGAGSQSISTVRNSQELTAALNQFPSFPIESQAIVQPLVSGRPLSVAALFSGTTPLPVLRFPLAEQQLSSDGSFAYEGGIIPAQHRTDDPFPGFDHTHQVDQLIDRIASAIPGLQGYIGFDLMLRLPHDRTKFDKMEHQIRIPDSPLVLVEINPRLTTSYLGYRQLTTSNLARYWLDSSGTPPVQWRQGPVHFLPDGVFQVDC